MTPGGNEIESVVLERQSAKMCPPGQGMPGRVYQIDAGWMGGAASIRYTERPFGLLGRAMLALMFIGIASLRLGSKIFPKC